MVPYPQKWIVFQQLKQPHQMANDPVLVQPCGRVLTNFSYTYRLYKEQTSVRFNPPETLRILLETAGILSQALQASGPLWSCLIDIFGLVWRWWRTDNWHGTIQPLHFGFAHTRPPDTFYCQLWISIQTARYWSSLRFFSINYKWSKHVFNGHFVIQQFKYKYHG